ncbi:hypothetical protein OG552_00115 [Streptomyces sp. NBC_01476]|uniref:hypothetical protein n=1 Tax=Streptomyces sp. NBC_01476 TaxID=2903881 RepID=UPI002E300C9B|nr:hypothetical protein [Streptomyces sp. NBC_01476]
MAGDSHPDVVVVGAQAGLPSGLWLAPGLAVNRIDTAATDIGELGTGVNTPGSPAAWDGTQAVTGHFATGGGFNDVLDYNPATATGTIPFGDGTGTALSPTSGHQINLPSPVFQDSLSGQTATSVASGGDLYNTVNGFPDLLLVLGGTLLDEPAVPTPGGFTGADAALPLSGTNPAGTGDWTGWTLTSALIDGLPALFARDTTGGSLCYYSPAELENLATPWPEPFDAGAPARGGAAPAARTAAPAQQHTDRGRWALRGGRSGLRCPKRQRRPQLPHRPRPTYRPDVRQRSGPALPGTRAAALRHVPVGSYIRPERRPRRADRTALARAARTERKEATASTMTTFLVSPGRVADAPQQSSPVTAKKKAAVASGSLSDALPGGPVPAGAVPACTAPWWLSTCIADLLGLPVVDDAACHADRVALRAGS